MTTETNVGGAERWASVVGGAALAAFALQQLRDEHPVAGAALAAASGVLIYRGGTGHCPAYAATGINTAGSHDTREALGGSRGVLVEESVVVNRPPRELYAVWRGLRDLPRFMTHLASVQVRDDRRSHWVARAPMGRTVEWDAEIINDIPGELIGWKTINGADVVSAGSVHFTEHGRGTDVRIRMQYAPPAGRLGAGIAWMLGQEPSQTLREDLHRFKQMMEADHTGTFTS